MLEFVRDPPAGVMRQSFFGGSTTTATHFRVCRCLVLLTIVSLKPYWYFFMAEIFLTHDVGAELGGYRIRRELARGGGDLLWHESDRRLSHPGKPQLYR